MISVVVYEGDTFRIRLPELHHDVDGLITSGADVSYELTNKATGALLDSGVMGWTPAKGWSAIALAPQITADMVVHTEVVAIYSGSQRTFTTDFRLRDSD